MDEKVFISYSREDSEWANRIMDILESNGISCWMDRAGITVGGKYTREIISAIKRCEIFLLVLSPNAEKSEWVPKELGMAIQNRKYIVPVKITDFTVEEFELQLENIQIFDADSLSMDETEHALVSTIQGVLQLNSEARGGGEFANPPGPAGTPPGLFQKRNKKKPKKPKSGKKGKKKWIAIAVAVLVFFFILGQGSEEDGAKEAMGTSQADSAAVQESIIELLGYVNQTESMISQIIAEDEEISNTEGLGAKGASQRRVDLSKKTLAQLAGLEEQAQAVECADQTFAAAVSEYFSMRQDSENSLLKIRLFLKDYYALFSVIQDKPMEDDYTSVENFYNDLNDWYQTVKEGYDAITSCPSNLAPQWKKYGEILDLNGSISYKLYLGNGYRDFLRTTSALNLSNRFYVVEPVLFEDLQSGWEDEIEFSNEQSLYATGLAEELRAYAELDGADRSGYVFQNIHQGSVIYDYSAVDTIYPSLYNTYNAFLVLKMGCVSGNRDLLVEAEIEGLTQKYKETIHLDTAYQVFYIKPPALTGELDLSSAKSAQLSLTISDMDGNLLEARTFPVTIKSKYDFEWYSNEYGVATKDNILCFLAPESEAIGALKRQAIEEISNMTGGQMKSFVGYQSNAWNNHYVGTYLQAAGLMRAMYEMGVRYNMDPFSLSGSNQHILLPDDVLERQSGLCIETSLVIASALQSANMHTFLVLPPGHAQVAVEIWDGHGSSTEGTGQYFLIETTSLSRDLTGDFVNGANALLENQVPQSGPITYMNQDQWKQYLAVEGTYLIDCDDASIMGLTPFAN